MDMQEWQGYVQKVAKSQYPVPEGMIKDYDDWRCRSIVGRMLYVLDDIEGAIMNLVEEAIAENPQSVADFRAGKDRAVGFLVGQIMKKSKGKANPSMVQAMLKEKLQ